MRLYPNSKSIFIFIGICLAVVLIYFWLNQMTTEKDSINKHRQSKKPPPVVLWWTPIIKNYHKTKQCGFHQCTFTVNRNRLNSSKAVVFYGSDINKTDLPLPRLPHHIWGLLHEESPKNVPYIPHDIILRHFNITSTFSRHSSLPLTTQYLKSTKLLTSHKYLVPIGKKTLLRSREKLAPVVFVQSICDTMSGRDEYVKELMQYIDVDSYGKCLHNKDLPSELSTDYLSTIESPEFYRFLARYKFIISYENGVCNDYITEKFWRPLILGSIPVYFGSPTVQDWEPTKKSVIHIKDFSSPKLLADFLKLIDANDVEYNSYLDHKYVMIHPIKNQLLLDTMLNDVVVDNIFDHFECFVCKQLHSSSEKENKPQADRRHYDCPSKLAYPPMTKKMEDSDWHSIAGVGKCQADILDRLLQRNTNFTHQEFEDLLTQDVKTNKCNF